MDFLKACTTNIYAVENVGQVHYVFFKSRHDSSSAAEAWSRLQTAVARLRSENVLCAAMGLNLCVFGDVRSSDTRTLAIDFDQLEEGAIESAAGELGSMRDAFMAAIELSIAHNMAKDPGILHVGPWTWLYSSGGDYEVGEMDSTVISLRTRVTAADGLYLISDVAPATCRIVDSTRYVSNCECTLAPFGRPARLLSVNSPKTPVSDEAWRTKVAETLQAQALCLPEDTKWVNVELLDHTDIACSWPLHFCLASVQRQGALIDTFSDHDWRRWFISTEEGAIFRNPLAMCEEWYKGSADRQRANEAPVVSEPKEANITDRIGARVIPDATSGDDTNMVISPSFAQRSVDHHSTMAGIYPTPPDGFAPGQPSALNSVVTPLATQPELNSSVAEAYAPNDELQPKAASRPAPSNEPGDHELAQEELFADDGGMAFGDAEIDDAEFDFFDEPDDGFVEHQAAQDSNMPDVSTYEDTEVLEAVSNLAQDEEGNHDPPVGIPPVLMPQQGLNDPTPMPMDTESDGLQSQEPAGNINPPIEHQPSLVHRPLSPFGIRERLLPPPVPASHSQPQSGSCGSRHDRRSSSFTPITFRDGVSATLQYGSVPKPQNVAQIDATGGSMGIGLHALQKKHRPFDDDDDSDADTISDSEEERDVTTTGDVRIVEPPPPLPWESKKRKRHGIPQAELLTSGPPTSAWLDEYEDEKKDGSPSVDTLLKVLLESTSPAVNLDLQATLTAEKALCDTGLPSAAAQPEALETLTGTVASIETAYSLTKSDLVCVAQIVSEQSVTANPHVSAMRRRFDDARDAVDDATSVTIPRYIRDRLSRAIRLACPEAAYCDLADLALAKDAPARQATVPGKISQGQPRPPQRLDNIPTGPDMFPLPAPYIRLHRGTDTWELLPACIPFWEPLGLGPAAGPKHLRAFCVFPFNEDLQRLVDQFLRDVGTAYESCKLGTHIHLRNVSELEQDNFKDGLAPVELSEDASLESVLRAYAATCTDLGKALSSILPGEERAIVVYILNPFTGRDAQQHLCACFWMLFQAHRERTSKSPLEQDSSDIFLQILPMNMVASFDAFVPLDARKMSVLAREVYDRCPPTSAPLLSDISAPLPNLAAPTVELASTAPKRLGFQLASEAPGDLLYEGSILHLAYAHSSDGMWLTACWIDSTGKHQSSSSFGLAGRTFAEVAHDVWEFTRTIMAARQVSWRVFIVAPGADLDPSAVQCWRSVAARPRSHPVCVTLLSTQEDPFLQLYRPCESSCYGGGGGSNAEVGVLTPASTPQGATFTSSPDVSGHTSNAPPTPAASETANSLPTDGTGESDAHLMDMTDETWGVLLSTKLLSDHHASSSSRMAHGVLFQRGPASMPDSEHTDTGDKLPSLGVNLHWTIQVKTQGGVDEGSAKQAELTLRDVLRMYRGLTTLTNARSLIRSAAAAAGTGKSILPVHVAMATMGAEGLVGLAPVVDDIS